MKKIAIYLTVLAMMSACNMSSAKTFQECEDFYVKTVNSESMTATEKASYLERNAGTCMQYETYNLWLAIAYQDAGDYAKSVKIAQAALVFAKEDKPNLLQVVAEAELQAGHDDEAFKQAEKIARDYPNYSPILGFLAEIATKNKDFEASFKYGEKSYQIEKNAGSLLWMAADLHQLERHEEAVNAVYKALELEPQRIQRVAGVLEGIVSLAALNRKEEATELAKRHIVANPNWQENATFVKVAKALGLAN